MSTPIYDQLAEEQPLSSPAETMPVPTLGLPGNCPECLGSVDGSCSCPDETDDYDHDQMHADRETAEADAEEAVESRAAAGSAD